MGDNMYEQPESEAIFVEGCKPECSQSQVSKQEPPVIQLVCQLEKATNSLEESFGGLAARLDGVSASSPETNKVSDDRKSCGQSALASRLSSIANNLEALNHFVLSTTENLEV